MRKVILSMLAISAIAIFFGCDKEEQLNIESGNLSGSRWVREYKYDGPVSRTEETYTVKFTSTTAGTRTRTGWYQTWQYSQGGSGGWSQRQTVNETDNFTYIYAPELRQGVITMNNRDYIFSISENYKELSWNGTYQLQ